MRRRDRTPSLHSVRALTLAGAALTALILAPSASAAQETASLGAVSALFSYQKGSDNQPYTGLALTITRAGTVAFQGPGAAKDCAEPYCYPSPDAHTVHVADLNGDGEPEVLLDLFTGGAHCCSVTRFFQFNGTGYSTFDHNFFDPGYRRRDIDGDHVVELVSGDSRFAYEFASYAESVAPIQIWHLATGGLTEVTKLFGDRIRKDAARAYGLYTRFKSRGAIAAWAADRYRLGQRTSTLKRLHRLAAAHRLPSNGFSPRSQRRFVTKLDTFLRGLGYG